MTRLPETKHKDTPTRRAVLRGLVKVMALLGLGFVAVPFIRFLVPESEDVVSLDIDISHLGINESMQVEWFGRRVIIYHRATEVLANLNESTDGVLQDPHSKQSRQPGFARNPFRSIRPEYLVIYSNCTHLGCDIAVNRDVQQSLIGFQCPCHQSNYDHSGRVLSDQPAPYNLEVPDYTFESGGTIRLLRRV
jgi:ubiquinol-cytochrome c reductase iron-sulfur subunit